MSPCNCAPSPTGPTLASTCGGAPFMLFMGLLEVFLRSQCDLEDPCGRPKMRGALRPEYDFVVVGGGSAGAVVASRLSEVPEWTVLLIEAGNDEPTGTQVPSMFLNFLGSEIDWGYQTEPEKMACLSEHEQRCYWPRGKVLGGTSVMNGMMYMRGARRDYDQWASLGNNGWSYNEVLPYFLKSEDNKQINEMDRGYHAQGGLLTVTKFPYHPPLSKALLKAGEEMGAIDGTHIIIDPPNTNKDDYIDRKNNYSLCVQAVCDEKRKFTDLFIGFPGSAHDSRILKNSNLFQNLATLCNGYPTRDVNGHHHTGFTLAQTTTRNGSRLSTSRAFLRPVKHRGNLHVLLNSTVNRILINQTTKTAYGVEVINNGAQQVVYASKEVVLSAGAVASPQVLLNSGVGPKEELEDVHVKVIHDLPGVGKNLHNHVAYFVNFEINDSDSAPLNWATAMEYLLFRDGLMSGTGISEVTGFVNSKFSSPSEDNPDLQLFFGGFLANCAKTGQVGEKLTNTSRQVNIIPTVLHPKSRGYLTLKDNNPMSYPKIYAKYLTHPDDIKVLVDGIKFSIKLTETSALKRYGFKLDKTHVKGCEKYKFGCDEYWECAVRMNTGPENHQVGSCKMGVDKLAVVNPFLQVHGIDRLRVIDASIMPTVPSGNTNAPAIMIAEKGADMIKSRWLTPEQGFFYTNHPNQRIDRGWGSWK